MSGAKAWPAGDAGLHLVRGSPASPHIEHAGSLEDAPKHRNAPDSQRKHLAAGDGQQNDVEPSWPQQTPGPCL